MSRNRRDVRVALCSALQSRRTDLVPPSSIENLIPNQSVLALTARTWALQNCMSLIPKTKEALRVGYNEPQDSKQRVCFQ
jgi:hypothetical protein